MAIEAARRNSRMGGAFRLWLLARALDTAGAGRVKRDDLRAALVSCGVNPRNWQRWITEARNRDLFTDVQSAAGEWYLVLTGAPRVALSMGLDSVGSRAAINITELFAPGWKAKVFSSWEDGKQISREQIQKTLNVSRSSQKYRDNQAGVKRDRNYSKSALKADSLTGIQENTKHKAPFILRDGFIAWRLPDTRHATATRPAGKGRGRKIRTYLHNSQQKGLSNMRRALSDGGSSDFIRLFNLTRAQRKQAERKLSKNDTSRKQITELYQRGEACKSGAIFWTHCPRN